MSQFHAHNNPNKASRKAYPYLLDIQSNLLHELRTTVVVPLSPASLASEAAITRLNPVVEIDGERFIALIPQMAGIDHKQLDPQVAELGEYRDTIVAALDFLISGV